MPAPALGCGRYPTKAHRALFVKGWDSVIPVFFFLKSDLLNQGYARHTRRNIQQGKRSSSKKFGQMLRLSIL